MMNQKIKLKIQDVARTTIEAESIITVLGDAEDKKLYQFDTDVGLLKQLYTKNQFTTFSEELSKIDEVV